ncbi:MAG: nucleotide sugar dehydrogenase [Candidatus Andersenbacteria bacterium]
MNKQKVAVVGLGYVGLPLAVLAQEKGWEVHGLDNNKTKVALINQGQSPIDGEQIAQDLKRYPIIATDDPAIVAQVNVIVIAVPTPVTSNNLPDLQPLTRALENILPHLTAGQVLIVESTINPGVMDEVVMPLLRQRPDLPLEESATPEPLSVAHCPERINPGDPVWTVRNIPRVLGGYTASGARRAQAFYESIIEAPIKLMASVTEAEAVKIMENTFRDVNIAFINEMAKSFAKLNVDIINVIAGAATKPFAFMPHYPGNGVGGHCISVDPYYMIERARQVGFDHEFLKLARQINDSMPAYTVELLQQGLQEIGLPLAQATVALLGIAYKKDIADTRESPALEILALLETKTQLRVFDPFVPAQSTVASLAEALQGANVVMLATNHSQFITDLTPAALAAAGIKLVVDGKNALDADGIVAQGIPYIGIGRARNPKK